MSTFSRVRAQAHAVTTLERAIAQDKVASSYLFEGPSGVGKQLAAVALARALIGEQETERIDAGRHPDVRIFEPRDEGHGNIQVEFLRNEILPFAQFAPFEARAACLIFPRADVSFPGLHPEAANAILKTLEEPRANVHFILLSERPDRLLPTIRSRCQRVRFDRLPNDVLESILSAQGVEEADRGAAIALAGGRADRALILSEEGTGQGLLELALDVDEALAGSKPGDLITMADRLVKGPDLRLALDTLATFYRDLACLAAGLEDEHLAFRHAAAKLRERAARLTAGAAASRVELLVAIDKDLDRNANPQVAVDGLMFRLRRAA